MKVVINMGLFKKTKKENLFDLGITDNTVGIKDQETILGYLLPDETVEAALYSDWGELFDSKKNMIVLTDKRVMAIKRGYLLDTTSGFSAIEYSNINSVSFEEPGKWGTPGKIGLDNILGKITITTQNTVFLAKVYKQYAKQVSDLITQHINTSHQSSSTLPPSNVPDIADQLTKLADLKEQGILTEEEFTAQKQKILGM